MDSREKDAETMSERSLEEIAAGIREPYCVAVIPCKTGSSRLTDKNFLDVDGYPMVMWTVMKAMCCPHIDQVCISTDNYDLMLEKAPALKAKMFDNVVCVGRGSKVIHPDTSIFLIIHDALSIMARFDAFKRPPTHVVMLQPNVPTLQQKVINALVQAVKVGPYNVARHFSVESVSGLDEWLAGPMSGGCDAYKIGALGDIKMMDAYNFAVLTEDPEVHTQADLDRVREIIARRKRDEP